MASKSTTSGLDFPQRLGLVGYLAIDKQALTKDLWGFFQPQLTWTTFKIWPMSFQVQTNEENDQQLASEPMTWTR